MISKFKIYINILTKYTKVLKEIYNTNRIFYQSTLFHTLYKQYISFTLYTAFCINVYENLPNSSESNIFCDTGI